MKFGRAAAFAAVICSLLVIPIHAKNLVVNREAIGKPEVRIFSISTNKEELRFTPEEVSAKRGVSMTVGDINGDHVSEIIIGEGVKAVPQVYVYSADGKLLSRFLAYQEEFDGGVRVAAGDLDGDGLDEIITAPKASGGPHVRIFTGEGRPIFTPGFFVFDKEDRRGIFISTIDLEGDGAREIITGSGGGRKHEVRIYDRFGTLLTEFQPENILDEDSGILAVGFDLDGTGREVIGIAPDKREAAQVYVYKSGGAFLTHFSPYGQNVKVGAHLSSFDLDNDGDDELITAPSIFGGPHIRFFNGFGIPQVSSGFFAFEEEFRGGIYAGAGDIDGDKISEIVAMQENLPESKDTAPKSIEVDLSEQAMRVYEYGFLIRSFLISSGKWGFATPQGRFKVYKKRKNVRMTWFYGEGNPNNYDLPNVPWVLYFLGPYTLHGTYWHNNFGHPMSHGCVNMRTSEVKWLYEFAPIGTTVWIH